MPIVAIVGVTGLVGHKILNLLEKRHFPVTNLYPIASSKRSGEVITLFEKQYKIICIEDLINKKVDLIFFVATREISAEWVPKFIKKNIICIDNSSQFRLTENIPLIIPEINGDLIDKSTNLICNPNCSTAQLLGLAYL